MSAPWSRPVGDPSASPQPTSAPTFWQRSAATVLAAGVALPILGYALTSASATNGPRPDQWVATPAPESSSSDLTPSLEASPRTPSDAPTARLSAPASATPTPTTATPTSGRPSSPTTGSAQPSASVSVRVHQVPVDGSEDDAVVTGALAGLGNALLMQRRSTTVVAINGADTPTGTLLSLPVEGPVTSVFGLRFHPILRVWKLHSGTDFAAPCGRPVGAAAPGRVVFVGWGGGNGNRVVIDHGELAGHRVQTTYNHLSAFGVTEGQQVEVHQGVGLVGNTGYSTGCHLHFEVVVNGTVTDPMPWLKGDPAVVDISSMTVTTPPVPTPTPTPTPEPTPSQPSASDSPTPSSPPSKTSEPTPEATPTRTTTPEVSNTPRDSATPSPSSTPSTSATPSPSQSATPSASQTPSSSPSQTPSGSPSQTPDASPSPTTAP